MTRRFALIVALAPLLAGCGGNSADLQSIVTEGEMVLELEGREMPLSVDVMDVFLVDPDDADRYPEKFVIHGPEIELVGSFPRGLRVGYEAEFSRMVGRTVSISPRADIDWDKMSSSLKIPAVGGPVRSGTFVVDRVLGHNPAGAGQILEGKLTLELEDRRTVRGTFTVLAKTWG